MSWVRLSPGKGIFARFYNKELKVKITIQRMLRGKYAVLVYELPRTYPRVLKRLDTEKQACDYASKVMKISKWY